MDPEILKQLASAIEALIVQGSHTNKLLEAKIAQDSDKTPETILEGVLRSVSALGEKMDENQGKAIEIKMPGIQFGALKGERGPEGKPGDQGDQGIGIDRADIKDGELCIYLTDGSELECGRVVGKDGISPDPESIVRRVLGMIREPKDGYTPERGKDYWTKDDQRQVAEHAAEIASGKLEREMRKEIRAIVIPKSLTGKEIVKELHGLKGDDRLSYDDLKDTPDIGQMMANLTRQMNERNDHWGGGGAATFLQLFDTPDTYKNQAGKVATVNAEETAIIFTTNGAGTVTSVNFSGGTTGLTTSGGPITSSGTITFAGVLLPANGGTGTTVTMTQGSVVFAGVGGIFSEDNSNFFWDDANNRLGIGTNAPTHSLTFASGLNGIALYNTADQVTNYERYSIGVTSNALVIGQFFGGTGIARPIRIGISSTAGSTTVGRYLEIAGSGPRFNFIDNTSGTNGMIGQTYTTSASSGVAKAYDTTMAVNQSGSSGYVVYGASVTENSLGSAQSYLARWQVGSADKLVVTNAGLFGLGITVPTSQVHLAGQTISGSATTPFMDITGTWNTTGVIDGAIRVNITQTATGLNSSLLNLKVGGNSKFSILTNTGGSETYLSMNTQTVFGQGSGTSQFLCSSTGIAFYNQTGGTVYGRIQNATGYWGIGPSFFTVAYRMHIQSSDNNFIGSCIMAENLSTSAAAGAQITAMNNAGKFSQQAVYGSNYTGTIYGLAKANMVEFTASGDVVIYGSTANKPTYIITNSVIRTQWTAAGVMIHSLQAIFGGATVDASAILQADSTTQGTLFPRMTTIQRNAIASPAEGLEVYDLTLHGKYFYNGTIWVAM